MTITFIDGTPLACPNLEAYWRDPAPFEAERERRRQEFNAALAGHDARVREAQEVRWAFEKDCG